MWLSSDEILLDIPLSLLESDFTAWEDALQVLQPIYSQSPPLLHDHENPNLTYSTSDEAKANSPGNDERKRKRMVSNRESARRSRMRKQKHLEDLRSQVVQFKIENHEMKNRLGAVIQTCHFIRTDNDKLRLEHEILSQRLSDIRRFLIFRQLQQPSLVPLSTVTSINERRSSLMA